jgi:hypothetical protein
MESVGLGVDEHRMSLLCNYSDQLRLVVLTPMPKPTNASLNITGSNVSAIFHEIRTVHILITSKNLVMDQPHQEYTWNQLELIFRNNFQDGH